MLYLERNLNQSMQHMNNTMLLLWPSAIREATTAERKIHKKRKLLCALNLCYKAIRSDIEHCAQYGELNYYHKITLLNALENNKREWVNKISVMLG